MPRGRTKPRINCRNISIHQLSAKDDFEEVGKGVLRGELALLFDRVPEIQDRLALRPEFPEVLTSTRRDVVFAT